MSLDALIEEAASEARSQKAVPKYPAPGAPAAAGEAVDFCAYWPIAKPVLETLATFIPKVGFLIRVIIGIGDRACPGK